MAFSIEYLGEGEINIAGVGTLGASGFDKKKQRRARITSAVCSQEIANQFKKDVRFKVLELPLKNKKKKTTKKES